ncbi:MFS transporter [Streptomyces sp. NY05-11A]|uniref:MFS transporter n=1 Tax=Streptomyces soliscabiei TaxID=588897 RepID=UPI0029A64888|nr:MFS transporter [Streptomyces sp. NY05-11A]MDX2683757.1 MFS transporter [Streptomyces sp. NY05-11A]
MPTDVSPPAAAAGRQAVGLIAICLAALMFGLEISSVPVILPTVGHALGGSFSDAEWIMSAYTIGVVTMLMPSGTLGDRLGHKRGVVAAVVVFGLASLLCGLAPSTGVLIAGRLVQGMSGGAMLACQIALLSHEFPSGGQRTRAFGWWGVIFGVGLGFGPAIGGGIQAALDWRWVFLAHAVIAPVAIALLIFGTSDTRHTRSGRVDVAGIATLVLGVSGLTFFITQIPSVGLTNAVSLAALGVAFVSLVCFVTVELRSEQPMIDFRVFRLRAFSGALLSSAGMNFSFWPLIIYLPVFLQSGLGYSASTASILLLAYTLPTLLLPPLAERLTARHQPGVIIPLGLTLIGAGLLAVRIGSGVGHPSWATVMPGMLLAGVGLGLTNTPTTNTTTVSVPSERSGMASGIDMSTRMTSLAVNISLMGLLLFAGISGYLRDHLPTRLTQSDLRDLTTQVVNGDTSSQAHLHGLTTRPAHFDDLTAGALRHGIGLVTLYGGIAVLLLALLSRLTFAARSRD